MRRLVIGFGERPPTVDELNLTMSAGEAVCLVGASGSGKSLTALALMRLTPTGARVSADSFVFEQTAMLSAGPSQLRRLRGARMAMVFQDPSLALNPVMTLGAQLTEALRLDRRISAAEARTEALALLDKVRFVGGPERLRLFAHQISGGMRQRALIAMALARRPALLIADEPTSSLDALLRRDILQLLTELRRKFGLALLLITHDLACAEEVGGETLVMFEGRIVERGPTLAVVRDPQHPYTLTLLAARPELERQSAPFSLEQTQAARAGCLYRPHCPLAVEICAARRPPLTPLSPSHAVACWRAPLELT